MASAIGRPINVDINTLKVERGRFTRVCVEVDLTIPVVGKIWVNGHWYKVPYEGHHLICTNCSCYGHLGRNCLTSPTVSEVTTQPQHTHPPHPTLLDICFVGHIFAISNIHARCWIQCFNIWV